MIPGCDCVARLISPTLALATILAVSFASPLAARAVAANPISLGDGQLEITHARLETASGLTPAAALDRFARRGETVWIGWSVPGVADSRDICCWRGQMESRCCSLADENDSWGTSSDRAPGDGPDVVIVLLEARDGRATRLRLLSPSCPVDGADRRVVWLGAADPGESLTLLDHLIGSAGGERRFAEMSIAAIAEHADSRADAILERRAFDASLDHESRKSAIFWAGEARGEAGLPLLDKVLQRASEFELREHALFALSQSQAKGALERLRRAAAEDRDAKVREQGLFWLSQTQRPEAGGWILDRLDAETDTHVREQAVFALSQLKDGTDWLIRVLHSKRDPKVVHQALFWLGQSDDPRALTELEKILDR